MLLKNLKFYLISTLSQIFNGTIILIFLIKILELNIYGEFAFGIALAGIISVFGDFGFSLITLKDIPQKKFNISEYVFNILIQKFVINIVVFFVGLLYILYLYYEDFFYVKVVFLILGIIISFNMYFIAFLHSINKFKYEAEASVLNIILVSLTLFFLYQFKLSFLYFCILFTTTSFLKLCWLSFRSSFFLNFKSLKINSKIQNYLIKNTWTFALHYILGILYFTIDSQIIYQISGAENFAIYNSSFKLIVISLMACNVLEQVLFPYVSKLFVLSKSELKNVISIMLNLSMIITVCYGALILVFDESLFLILFKSEYLKGTAILFPLILMCVFRAIASVYGMLLTVSDSQLYRVLSIFLSLIVNIIANLLLIPNFGIIGAAYASFLTHLFLVFIYMFFIKKTFKTNFLNKYSLIIFITSIFLIFSLESFSNVLIGALIVIPLLFFSMYNWSDNNIFITNIIKNYRVNVNK